MAVEVGPGLVLPLVRLVEVLVEVVVMLAVTPDEEEEDREEAAVTVTAEQEEEEEDCVEGEALLAGEGRMGRE